MDKIGDLPQDDPIARGDYEESVVHIAAKQMMLRDLRGHLDDWEEGKFTWLDLADVWHNINNIMSNHLCYIAAALGKAEPKQLPLFPEDDGSVRVNF